MDENPWQQPAPWQQQPWQVEPRSNPVAVWSWVLALPCALAGLALGVVGLVLAHRRGGAGRVHAVVGVVASATVLVLGTTLTAIAIPAFLNARENALAGGSGRGDVLVSDDVEERRFIDGLYEETYLAFDDTTLLAMGYDFCSGLDAGATPPEADAELVSLWDGLDLDAAYDVEWEATHHLCPAHASSFEEWDPALTDGQGGTVDV